MSLANHTMLIVHAVWNEKPSFKLIPFSSDAIYQDIIFDSEEKGLGVVSRDHKQKLQYIERLDENGEAIPKRGRGTQLGVQLQRIQVEAFYEYYLNNENDIRSFVERVAINPEHPAFREFFPAKFETAEPQAGSPTFVEPAYGTDIIGNPRLAPLSDDPDRMVEELPEVTAALDPEQTPDNTRSIAELGS